MKTVYCLKIRDDNADPWGPTTYYRTRKERNHDERLNCCLGGFRTHSFEEKKTAQEVEELFE